MATGSSAYRSVWATWIRPVGGLLPLLVISLVMAQSACARFPGRALRVGDAGEGDAAATGSEVPDGAANSAESASGMPERLPGPPMFGPGGGGLPEAIRTQQDPQPPREATVDDAIRHALTKGVKLRPELPRAPRQGSRVLRVPAEYASIGEALGAALAGDTVEVAAGTYREQVEMKPGVRLVSDSSDGGDEFVPVEGCRLPLPRRTLRTIIDGSGTEPSRRGMVDFAPGSGPDTVVDGFTIQSLPRQNHHEPGHAHAINVRGSSPIIAHCYIRSNGSTGIGNHVIYRDQGEPIDERDFRVANVLHPAEPVIYRNIIRGNLGLGVGCNHLSAPTVLGNEILENDDSDLGEGPTPGIGCKHGARPVVVGNVVHHNPGGGILAKPGARQGAHPVDRATLPRVSGNAVFENGDDRPGISCRACGEPGKPVRIESNFVIRAGGVGIGLLDGCVANVVRNTVCASGEAGVGVVGSEVLYFDRNHVVAARGPGVVFARGSRVHMMRENAVRECRGGDYLLRGSRIFGRMPSSGTRQR